MKFQNILRFTAIFAIVFVVSAAPLSAEAATFFGPIVPAECNCHEQPNPDPNGPPLTTAPSYGCVLATIQNVVNFGITIGLIAAILAIAYAGFTWMMSGGNPEKRAAGRSMILNVVIGLIIVLSAWLIVDFVMKQLYNPAHESAGVTFGPWNDILAGDTSDRCIMAGRPTLIPGLGGSLATGILGGDVGTNNSGQVSSGSGGGSCTAIPDSQLATIPSSMSHGGVRKALPDTVQRFMSMHAAARAAGFTISAGSAYRSPESQLATWNDLGCRRVNGRTVCNRSTAALPCSLGGSGSNHTRGTAIDISTSAGGQAWLLRNGPQYGFMNINLPNDRWHFSRDGH